MTASGALTSSVLIPLIAALAVVVSGRKPNLREALSIIAGCLVFAVVVSVLPAVVEGQRPGVTLFKVTTQLHFALEAEPLGILFALLASFLWVVTTIYSIGYMRAHQEKNQTRFYAFFAIAIACVMGVAFAANLFTLFVFYEALTLCTYPLVTHSGSDEARRAGRTYLGVLLTSSIALLLVAIVIVWVVAGTLNFESGGVLADKASPMISATLCFLFAFGIGKAALMPLHVWLPKAMVAPTPVSALLHAVAVVKAGVFSILKVVVYIIGVDNLASIDAGRWVAYIAGATIVIASIIALRQDNLKARLAYSTVSQLSYIVLAAFVANATAVIGSGMHIVMHAFAKITLFFCAGAIMVAAHKTRVSEMHGIGRAMPITMVCFLIGSLGVIGLPPMGGTWSKWYIVLSTVQSGDYVLLVALMVSSLLSIAYLLPIGFRAFFLSSETGGSDDMTEAPAACLLAIAITSLGCVALFFFSTPIVELLTQLVD